MKQVVVSWTGKTPGRADICLDGRYAVVAPNGVVTESGTIKQPTDWNQLVFVAVSPVERKILLDASAGGPDRAFEWDATVPAPKWTDLGACCGDNSVIYDRVGTRFVSHCEPDVGSQGWIHANGTGRASLVPADRTKADVARGLFCYIDFGDIAVGQGDDEKDGGGIVVWVKSTAKRHRVVLGAMPTGGAIRDMRIDRFADSWAIAATDYSGKTYLTWCSTTELTAGPVLGEVSQPPTSAQSAGLQAFDRKMWIAPFFSFSEKYGDTPIADYTGNAMLLVENDTDSGELARDLARLVHFGYPLIVHGRKLYPAYANTTVAYWAGSAAEAKTALSNSANSPYEKPVIWYEDVPISGKWPSAKPAWVNERVWPAVQCYRTSGENLAAFETRIRGMFDVVKTYGRPMVMVPRFDDFNGSGSVAQTLEAMPVYARVIADYEIIGFLPFADRRGNGIAKNPDLQSQALAFLRANPARPNRFDYWQPASVDMPTLLKNKFGQSTLLIALTAAEKQFILDAIRTATPVK